MTEKPITYTCDLCGGVYQYEWSEEEANEEFKDNFGREVDESDGIVCDDCYKKIMPQIQN